MKSGGFLELPRTVTTQLFNWLFPLACPLCLKTFPPAQRGPLCRACLAEATPLPPAHCPVCALPFCGSDNSSHLCGRCIKRHPTYTKVFVAGLYEKSLQHAIQRFKFNQRLGLDRSLGQLLHKAVDPTIEIDIVVPVPLSRLRLQQRGYNQSLLLAREFSRLRGLKLAADLLHKIHETSEQHGLSARERETNLKGAFALKGCLAGETILLVDDVLTTGETAEICSQVLARSGAGKIYVAVIARAP